MPRPQPQPVMHKAPRKEHPYAPPAAHTVGSAVMPAPAATAAADTENGAKPEKIFSTRLSPTLIRQVKTRALAKDVSVQVLVATALTEYLNRQST